MEKLCCIRKGFINALSIFIVSCFFIACNDDPDNYKSIHNYDLELKASSNEIILNENTPDEIALTLEWTSAHDLGSEFILTYVYEADLEGKKPTGGATAIKEYEDGGVFKRTYTHKQLQEMLVNDWLQLTSTNASIKFTVTASYEGSNQAVPDISTVVIKIKTYGEKQFLADKLFMSGTAVGEDVEITPSKTNAQLYVYTGELTAGTINFPITYQDEVKENVVSPLTAQQNITEDAMDAIVEDKASAGNWMIKDAGKYRVSVNFATKTVTIIPAGDIIDVEKIYLAGTAVDSEMEVLQTLENENVFAFRGELKAGSLYLPILFEGDKALSIVPKVATSNDIKDGQTVTFAQNETAIAKSSNHWNIPTAGTYRIVVDIDNKTIAIYSAATDMQPKEITWKNTVVGDMNFVSKVERLYVYGNNNGAWGFSTTAILEPSTANPNVFVYSGAAMSTAGVRFTISNIASNVWAYGPYIAGNSASNGNNKFVAVADNVPQTLEAGQGANRYTYYTLPANTNFVVVDIEKLTVVFDQR